MEPLHKVYTQYNPYFFVPLILWFISGGVLLMLCTPQQLFSFANTNHSNLADTFMYYTTWLGEGITITLILLSLLFIRRFRNWWYVLTALFCVGLPALISQIIKHMYDLPRPYNYFHKATWIHFSSYWGEPLMDNSFPSGHTTGAFAIFCLLTMLLPAKYSMYGLVFFLLALSVAYSRLYLAAHFFADVYVGSILGSVTSLLIFAIAKKYKPILV